MRTAFVLLAALTVSACASSTETYPGRTATEQLLVARAEVIFEVRAGALSLEQMRRVVGLPPLAVPINENLNVVSLPELSLYSRRDRVGVAEFSGFIYDAYTGKPLGAVAPMIGEYRIRSHKVLMIVSWGQQDVRAGEQEPGDSWMEF